MSSRDTVAQGHTPQGSTPDMSTTAGKIADLHNRLAETRTPVGEQAVHDSHAAGSLTARERVELLLDDGSFVETDALARHRSRAFGADADRPVTDGIVSGHGTIDGRSVCVISQDASIWEGRIGETNAAKILKVLDLALKSGTPLVTIYDGLGARTQEGVAALEFLTRILREQSRLSGVIPQIGVVAGPIAGELLHNVVLNDVVIAAGNHVADTDALDGVASLHTADDRSALDLAADVLSYLPGNNRALPLPSDFDAPTEEEIAGLDAVIPDSDSQVYDIREVLDGVLDTDSLLELRADHATQLITGFARIEGTAIGLIASQPAQRGGAIDSDAAEKAAHFIRICDAFNVPIVTFVDSPGLLDDPAGGSAVRRCAKLIAATVEASVGKISVVTRKAYGSAYLMLGAKRLGTDLAFAWPTGQIAIAELDHLVEVTGAPAEQLTDKLINPYAAAERGLVDAVLRPAHTRAAIADGLRLLERKIEDAPQRKHDTTVF